MRKCFRKKILSVFLVLLSIIEGIAVAHAQAIVSDTQSTAKTIKQWFTEVKESKTVVSTMQTIQKTNAAIGTAKKSVSEYVLENKEKLEEKIAKVQEYKRNAEEYKKEYDAYKKQLDENIAKAKELKEQAETGIETAKETASAAKDAASSAIDAAQDKVGISSEGEEPGSSAPSEVSENATSANDTKVLETNSTPEQALEKPEVAVSVAPETATINLTPNRLPFDSTKEEEKEINVDTNSMPTLNKEEGATSNSSESKEMSIISDTPIKEVKDINVKTNTTAITTSPAVSSSIVEKKVLDQEAVEPLMQTPSVTAPNKSIQLRKAFTTSSLHQSEKLMFAKVEMLNLPDGGTDSNGTVIIPKTLAMYCGLSSSEALEAGKLDECLLRLNKERESAQLFSGSDAPKVYNQAMAQYVAASMAEAYKARQDAESFEENFIDAIDFAPEPTAQDVYDNIVELNKAIDMQMNGLLRVLSSQLMVQSLYNYGSYSFVPEEAEEEKGNE